MTLFSKYGIVVLIEMALENKITKIRGSSEFLRFILNENDKIIHNPTRKNTERLAYSPIEAESEYGITPKQQIEILRILKDKYKCLSYKRYKYSSTGKSLEVNWERFKELVERKHIDHDDAIERLKYKTIKVSLKSNCGEVYSEIFALEKVVYKATINIGGAPSCENSVKPDAPISLFINDKKICKTNSGSNTRYVLEKAFADIDSLDEETLKDGFTVKINRNMKNLSDTLSSTVRRNDVLKKLLYSDVHKKEFKVYPEITNSRLGQLGFRKADVDDIINSL